MQPSTDNIYKFSATFGLLIIFFSSYYTLAKIYDLEIEKSSLTTEVLILNIDLSDLEKRTNELKDEINVFNKNSTEHLDNEYVKEALIKYGDELKDLNKQSENLVGKNELINIKNRLVNIYIFILILSLLIGIPLFIFGFRTWYKIDKSLLDKNPDLE